MLILFNTYNTFIYNHLDALFLLLNLKAKTSRHQNIPNRIRIVTGRKLYLQSVPMNKHDEEKKCNTIFLPLATRNSS